MNIRIIQVILDVFDHYGENIRFEEERFEEALNDEEIKKTYSRNYNLLYNALTKGNTPKEAKPKPSIFKKLKK